MKLLKIFSIGLFVSFSLLVMTPVFAEKAPVQKSIIIAKINVYDIKVVSQKDNVFNLSAVISNGESLQKKNLTYSLSLVGDDGITVDEFISPRKFNLSPNSRLILDNIVYKAPSEIVGNYHIFLEIRNGDDILGLGNVGVTLTAPSKILVMLKNIYSNPIIYIIIGVLVVAGAVVYFIKLKKKQNEKINQ